MRSHPFYLVFGALVVIGAAYGEWRYWPLVAPASQRVSPRSVRENPGAYRSVYRSSARYHHGK